MRESSQSNEKRIWYRIGINVGDVVLDDGDIYGNSVNIASRLESIADAGDISCNPFNHKWTNINMFSKGCSVNAVINRIVF